MRPPPAGLLIGLAILVVGCQGAAAGRPVPTGDDLVVGAAISLTGSRAGEGQLTQQGYLLWRDWMNERGGIEVGGVRHRVRLLVQDDESRAEQAAALADQLVRRRGARFLLGPYGSDATAAVAAVAERLGIPHVAGNGAALAIFSQGHRYTFGVLSPSDRYMTSVLDLAATLRPQPRTIAMLAADDSFSLEVAESVRAQASARGFQVVLDERYPAGSTAVAALVARAAALAPDILLNSGHLAEAVAIHRAARTLGLDARIFAYSVGPSTPDFVAELGPDADYVLVGSQWSPQVRYRPQLYLTTPEYIAAYKRTFRTLADPAYQTADATAAAIALERAIEDAGSTRPDAVRDALARLDVVTFYGRLRFDGRGANVFKPMVVEQIQRSRRHTVYPADVADARVAYPTPPWAQRA